MVQLSEATGATGIYIIKTLCTEPSQWIGLDLLQFSSVGRKSISVSVLQTRSGFDILTTTTK